jgi:hypothetical protein
MPPGKECPHCHIIHRPVRQVIKTGPFTQVVHYECPLQCSECGAQMHRTAPDRVISKYQDLLQAGE